MKQDHRNAEAKARDEFMNGSSIESMIESGILKDARLQPYLKNRIENAFLHGIEAGKKITAEKAIAIVSSPLVFLPQSKRSRSYVANIERAIKHQLEK